MLNVNFRLLSTISIYTFPILVNYLPLYLLEHKFIPTSIYAENKNVEIVLENERRLWDI